jgi:hypothetical protein
MDRRCVFSTARALTIILGILGAPLAQSASNLAPIQEWAYDFTVLTIAPDGAWGTATEPQINRAIAGAINNCKAMSGANIGCGAHFTTVQRGWSIGVRCGDQNIIVADRTLLDAEHRAVEREIELRKSYAPNMPPCVRVVTVDPNGIIVVLPVGYSDRKPALR